MRRPSRPLGFGPIGHARPGRWILLDLAIGTGRVGLPLAARGVLVEAIDASEKMVAKLRAKPGGAFVVECPVPDRRRHDDGRHLEVLEVTEDSATIEASDFDAATQHSRTQTITFADTGIRLRPHFERYTWPDEPDLMAAAAGLRLAQRYVDWHRQPFGPDSSAHISVYRPA